jgi:uncharacterized repeat protein (TIGR03803 family)
MSAPILDANGRTVAPAPQTRISRVRRRAEIATTALVIWFLLGSVAAPQAHAQTFTVFYSFTGYPENGVSPFGGLVMDPAGNLYGVTQAGGSPPPFDGGTVFKLDPSGNESVLHSFTGGDGSIPYAGLVIDTAGNLYGTTLFGGSSGYGTVFKLDPSGTETVLHSFAYSDGAAPVAGLVMDPAGNLYGTAHGGGSSGNGTVFKLTLPVTYNSLIDLVNLFVTKSRVAANLVATLERAQAAAGADNKKATDHQLHVFIRQVSARSGKSLTTAQAAILIQQAKALMI